MTEGGPVIKLEGAEERQAWDRFAAAFRASPYAGELMSAMVKLGTETSDVAKASRATNLVTEVAAVCADRLVVERRARIGTCAERSDVSERRGVIQYLRDWRDFWTAEAERCSRNQLAVDMAQAKVATLERCIEDVERGLHHEEAAVRRRQLEIHGD